MRRTSDELRMLGDCFQLVVTVAALVTLALPWWSYGGYRVDHTRTGWDALASNAYGQGWGLLIAVGVTGVATVFHRRWLHWVAAVIAVLGAIIIMVGAANQQSGSKYDEVARAHAGLWLGGALALLVGAAQVLEATVGVRRMRVPGEQV